MRVVKNADERKNEILDIASDLFTAKGYDGTSISDIIEKAGVARGTVYHHFKSKEDVLNALIERVGIRFLTAAKEIAEDKSIPVFERLFKTLLSLFADTNVDSKLNDHIHKPQNALMHQKTHELMLKGIPPILTGIIEDGVREKLFDTPHPYETVEMVVAYVITVFDDDYMPSLSPEEQMERINAFVFNMERLFGAKAGSFAPLLQLFRLEGGNNE